MINNYTKNEMITLVKNFGEIFEVTRLVDVSMTKQFELTADGDDFIGTEYSCYAVWNKHRRCENCVSAKAFACKSKMTKFEFIDNEVFHVVAKYVEMDGVPYMLELVTKIDDSTLFGAYGKDEFVQTITSYNKKLYVDNLTNAYNRNYYEEQLAGLSKVSAMAMVDLDKFKNINDTYGHDVGDMVLKGVVNCIQSNLRATDAVIRYGGDEFIIIFRNIPEDVFVNRLESIRKSVEDYKIESQPDVNITVSIGGHYCKDDEEVSALKSIDEKLYKAKESRNQVVIY